MKKKKEHNRTWWKHEADTWFSRYIRQRDKNKGCYTCDTISPKLQCGHFIPRQYLYTRYNEVNNHAQCFVCNMLKNGEPGAYAIRLQKEYGDNIVKDLENSKKIINRDMDYQKIAMKYKEKYEALIKKEDVL